MSLFFTDSEISGLQPRLVELLNLARGIAHTPFVITSGFRTPEHNMEIGGASNSAHLRGLAVDLRVTDSNTRFKIVSALLEIGFRRIVVYASDGHLHVDCDPTLPQDVFVVKP